MGILSLRLPQGLPVGDLSFNPQICKRKHHQVCSKEEFWEKNIFSGLQLKGGDLQQLSIWREGVLFKENNKEIIGGDVAVQKITLLEKNNLILDTLGLLFLSLKS